MARTKKASTYQRPQRIQETDEVKGLRDAGLFNFEIRELTATQRVLKDGTILQVPQVNLNTPFLKDFIERRKKEWEDTRYMANIKRPIWVATSKARAEYIKQTSNEFRTQVMQQYLDKGWVVNETNPDGTPKPTAGNMDFWAGLRQAEEEYKQANPDYVDSPRKKQKGSHHKTKMQAGDRALQREKARVRGQLREMGVGIDFKIMRQPNGNIIKVPRFNTGTMKFD